MAARDATHPLRQFLVAARRTVRRTFRDTVRLYGHLLPRRGPLRTRRGVTVLADPPARGGLLQRWGAALGLAAVALAGAWLGLLAVGNVRTEVGPVNTTMTLRPSLTGGTKINVPPLGALQLQTHRAPLRLDVDVDQLDPIRSTALVDHPERITGLEGAITKDVAQGTEDVAERAVVAVFVGATVLGLAVYRRPGRALVAGGLAFALLAASGATAYATWNPKSLLEPKFSGLLASAPSVVGSARSLVTDFGRYQDELARLVTNVTKLYEVTSTLPAYQPDPTTIRILHVSDIHLNPAAWSIIKSLVKQYDIDLIIDSGDTMDHGTAAENGFLDPIPDLGAPYVWVRGNHDSIDTQKAMAKLGGDVHVLDNGVPVTVDGVRIVGIGDPQFTPDRSIVRAGDPGERRAGRALAFSLRAQKAAGTPVGIAVTHNPVAVSETDGLVPLALAGHIHHRHNEVLDKGTRLMVEGTTGGGGLRAVEDDNPQKVEASVLYLDQKTDRLQAWDEITLGGLGLATAEVSRHLPDEPPEPEPSESPSPSPSGSGSGTPAGTLPPSAEPSGAGTPGSPPSAGASAVGARSPGGG